MRDRYCAAVHPRSDDRKLADSGGVFSVHGPSGSIVLQGQCMRGLWLEARLVRLRLYRSLEYSPCGRSSGPGDRIRVRLILLAPFPWAGVSPLVSASRAILWV